MKLEKIPQIQDIWILKFFIILLDGNNVYIALYIKV
jgi:hypothetical protein